MSVINKMLRDLDRRAALTPNAAIGPQAHTLRQSTHPIRPLPDPATGPNRNRNRNRNRKLQHTALLLIAIGIALASLTIWYARSENIPLWGLPQLNATAATALPRPSTPTTTATTPPTTGTASASTSDAVANLAPNTAPFATPVTPLTPLTTTAAPPIPSASQPPTPQPTPPTAPPTATAFAQSPTPTATPTTTPTTTIAAHPPQPHTSAYTQPPAKPQPAIPIPTTLQQQSAFVPPPIPTPSPKPSPPMAAATIAATTAPPNAANNPTNNLALKPSLQTTPRTAPSVNNNNTTAALRPPVPPTATSTATATPNPDSNTAQRQQQATRDTLAQAQTLWNNGEQDAAFNLLTQAQETLERNVAKSPTAPQQSLLAATVRELTRYQIQQGRLASANANLVRLEPLLPKDADIWALRANLSQRLGRHADSLHAYLSALELRPDEPRWLLGAAVSLAATGQTSRAGELAAQAQQSGPIQRDIQQYLVQMGVSLKER